VPTTIRTATTDDVDAIAELTRQLGYAADAPEMHARLARMLARSDQLIVVAETEDRRVVGWLHATTSEVVESGLRAEIAGLVVADCARRQGIGRLLVAHAEQWAAAQGAPVMVVRSNLKRVESHAFYPSLGYTNTKNQAVYRKPLLQKAGVER
jgi:predicted N-acetyltransferase YhbS